MLRTKRNQFRRHPCVGMSRDAFDEGGPDEGGPEVRGRLIARAVEVWVLILVSAWALTACTGTTTPTLTVGTSTSAPGLGAANPLVGDWLQTYTCTRRVS